MFDSKTYTLNIPVKSCQNCKNSTEDAYKGLLCKFENEVLIVHQCGICKNFKSKILKSVSKSESKKL